MGLPFLSYLVYPTQIRLARRSRVRFSRKIKIYIRHYQTGDWSGHTAQRFVLPLLAFTEKARKGAIDETFYRQWAKRTNRVLRGGSWNNDLSKRNDNNGFRLVSQLNTQDGCQLAEQPLPDLSTR